MHDRDRIWECGQPARRTGPQGADADMRGVFHRAEWVPLAGLRMSRLPIARSGVATAASSQAHEPARHGLHSLAIEQVDGEFDGAIEPGRRAVRGVLLAERKRTGRTALAVVTGSGATVRPGRSRLAGGVVLQRPGSPGTADAATATRRVERLHQGARTEALMAVGGEMSPAPARISFQEARIAGRVATQHQHVDETRSDRRAALSVRPCIGLRPCR